MSYRSFCSVVLRPGGGVGEENGTDAAPASSITKMTSIVQITSDDATVPDHLEDHFFDHHRDDFFSRKDDEFQSHRRRQQMPRSDGVVTCDAAGDVSSPPVSSLISSQAVDSSEEQALEGAFWCSGQGKVTTESSIGDTGSVIQVVQDCDTAVAGGGGGVSATSFGGGQEKSSVSRPVSEAVSAISVKENDTEECSSAVCAATVSAAAVSATTAAAAAAVPLKTSGGNNTTKVYLNAEEIEKASVIQENSDCLNISKPGEPDEAPLDEKGEVSETESDTKTETSETESETKACDVVEAASGTAVIVDGVCKEKLAVTEVVESDKRQHPADALLSPPLSLDSSNQESILDSLETVDTAISGRRESLVKSEHSIVLEVNPQAKKQVTQVEGFPNEDLQKTTTSTTELVEDAHNYRDAVSENSIDAGLVETSQFVRESSDALDLFSNGATSPATLDFEEEDSAPASLSAVEDILVEKLPKTEKCVDGTPPSNVALKLESNISIDSGSVPTPGAGKPYQESCVVVQQILKQELTNVAEEFNLSETALEKSFPEEPTVQVTSTKADVIPTSSLEKSEGEDRSTSTELDLPLLTKSVKELAAEIAQAETGSKTVPAPGNPRKGKGASEPTTAKQLPQVVVAKPRLSKTGVPKIDSNTTFTNTTQDASQADSAVAVTKDDSTSVLQQVEMMSAELQTPLTAAAVSQASSPALLVTRAADVGPSSASDDESSELMTVIKRSFTSIQLKEGEVDEASILSAKGATKQYWEDRMMAAAVGAEETGWEPVANVCFRDPNAPADSSDEQSEEGSSLPQDNSPTPEFLPAPPPQFDNSPPASFEETTSSPAPAVKPPASVPAVQTYEEQQKANAGNKDEKLINLDEEISILEREVLGDDDDDEEETEMMELMGEREMEEVGQPNLQYVYGEEGSPEVKKPLQQQITRRGGEPNRIPTVKSTLTAAQIKENVIEAEIRAQQKRERELQQEQKKKQQLLMLKQQNLHNSQKSDDILRKKGASSPQDSDEGFVDPPVERNSTVGGGRGQGDSEAKVSPGFTHSIPGADGESVIYDAVSPAPINGHAQRSAPVPATRASVPNAVPKAESGASPSAPATSNTTETKIALEIRELKEREEELRRMRDARLAAKKNGTSEAEADEEFVSEEHDLEEDAEDRGSSSSRELLDEHLASLTTTTDEGNYSECGDATSSEDKSSNGSNSRIMSPEVPSTEYPRPPRRVTVRPYQADEEEDQPVYTRMKNESVIEREIRIAKERDEAFKKEKGLMLNGAAAKIINGTANGKHAALRQSASLSSISSQQNGPRDAQQHLATSRIQLEIAESSQRERELMSVGKVLTLSEDAVDHKVTRLSDLCELPTAQVETQARTKSPTSSSASTRSVSSTNGGGSSRQSPNASPHSTLNNSGRLPQQNGHNTPINGLSNTHHFNGFTNGGSSRLTRSLSTTNLSSPSSLTTVNGGGAGLRPPKGFMEKFIASRGKMTPSAFSSPPPMGGGSGRVVVTRPMRVQPKTPVVLRQQGSDATTEDDTGKLQTAITATCVAKVNGTAKSEPKSEGKSATPQAPYKRFIGAEEKIQEELRDMQQREEELRQLRSRNMARSQPNLLEMGLSEISFEEEHQNGVEEVSENGEGCEEADEAGIRSAVSNPNLLEDGPEAKTLKNLRRRSTLIAEWENRIQATTVADA